MKITWIGHSCFKVEEEGYRIVIDPYDDGSVPGLLPVRERADEVLVSHEHFDHNARNRVDRVMGIDSPFTITKVASYHDDHKGAIRGRNTIHIISTEKNRIAHLGDLGCELRDDQIQELRGLDLVLIPVGGHYTIDAIQAAELVKKIRPAHAVPMHYREKKGRFGFKDISTIDKFIEQTASVIYTGGSTLDLDKLPAEKIIVLTPKNMKA